MVSHTFAKKANVWGTRLLSEDLAHKIVNALQDATAEALRFCAAECAECARQAAECKALSNRNNRYDGRMWQASQQWKAMQKTAEASSQYVAAYALLLEGVVWFAAGKANRGVGTLRRGLEELRSLSGMSYYMNPFLQGYTKQEAKDFYEWKASAISQKVDTVDRACQLVVETGCENIRELLKLIEKMGWEAAFLKARAPLTRVFARVEYDVIEALGG